MTDDQSTRVNMSIPLGDQLSVGNAEMAGTPMNHITVRGDRGQAESLVLHLLAELTGDEGLFDHLEFGDIRLGLRTLGEIGAHGLDVDLEGELSEPQKDVLDLLGRVHTADMQAQGMQ